MFVTSYMANTVAPFAPCFAEIPPAKVKNVENIVTVTSYYYSINKKMVAKAKALA